jgi:ammonium transporter, Amt family
MELRDNMNLSNSFALPIGSIVPGELASADIAWMLVACAMVLLMTPALAFFYGGLVRSKNVLNTMMMSLVSMGVVAIAWVMLGYSLAFGDGTLIGDLRYAFLEGVGLEAQGTIPHLLFMAFQGTFAIITAALISGAVVERMRFGPYLVFITAWSLLVYAPVCHWVWGGGWLAELGALDFAGGTVVHINAAVAAFVAAMVVGPRKDYGRQAILPHNVPFVVLGAGLLWFGWFGFNGGSALAADGLAALAFVNTMLAPAATLTAWVLLDLMRNERPSAVGGATAIVVGLVAVTPAAGFVGPLAALLLGAVAAVPSYYAIRWRAHSRLDDSLDVVAAHGLGGLVGAMMTGVLAREVWGGVPGLLDGNVAQVGIQFVAVLGTATYSALASLTILKAISVFARLRVGDKLEGVGMDRTEHAQQAYATDDGAVPGPSKEGRRRRTTATIALPEFKGES